jgi:hypothetical protein
MQKLAFQAAQLVPGTNSGKCMQTLARGMAVPTMQTYIKLAFQAAQSVAGTNSGKCMQTLARGMAVPAIQTYAKASLSSHSQPEKILDWCLAPMRVGGRR